MFDVTNSWSPLPDQSHARTSVATGAPITVSVAEAARLLSISKSKVYAMVKSGELPHVHTGRRLTIPVVALIEWVAARTEGGK